MAEKYCCNKFQYEFEESGNMCHFGGKTFGPDYKKHDGRWFIDFFDEECENEEVFYCPWCGAKL